MITCKHCHSDNKDGSHFCAECGGRLTKASQKRNRVMGKRRRKAAAWKYPAVFGAMALLVIVFAVMNRAPASNPKILAQPRVVDEMAYDSGAISMVTIEPVVADGRITIPVKAVTDNQLVRFHYETGRGRLPLLAYLTPSGRLVTAVSVCEPCRSTRFHIEGETIACNSCDTRWDLETLTGISGGCLAYPPDFIPSTIQGENIVIDETVVKQWRPRA